MWYETFTYPNGQIETVNNPSPPLRPSVLNVEPFTGVIPTVFSRVVFVRAFSIRTPRVPPDLTDNFAETKTRSRAVSFRKLSLAWRTSDLMY